MHHFLFRGTFANINGPAGRKGCETRVVGRHSVYPLGRFQKGNAMDWLSVVVLVIVGWVAYRQWKWAFLYTIFGCQHCNEDPCTCPRCPSCNHRKSLSPIRACEHCGWRPSPQVPAGPAYGSRGPLYPPQDPTNGPSGGPHGAV
jgi:hypothetical protein